VTVVAWHVEYAIARTHNSRISCPGHEVGDRFAIREEGRTIGSGVVTRVVA